MQKISNKFFMATLLLSSSFALSQDCNESRECAKERCEVICNDTRYEMASTDCVRDCSTANSDCMQKRSCDTRCEEQPCTRQMDCDSRDMSCDQVVCRSPKKVEEDQDYLAVKTKDESKTKEIISCFSCVVRDMGKMMMEPNNPECVRRNICSMMENMIQIGMTMTRSMPMPMSKEDVTKMACSMDEETMRAMMQTMCDEMTKLRTSCCK